MAPGTGFVEDNFPTELGGREAGVGAQVEIRAASTDGEEGGWECLLYSESC